MRLDRLIGNERLKTALAPFFRENFPQSVILEGPSGIGKKTAAFEIAENLLCTGANPPCGVCGACVRMRSGSHPDYHLFNAEAELIRVNDVREIRRQSFIRPSEAAQKVFIINEAHRMNPQAQNALLKVLEEPQETIFILLCVQAGQLLQTVRSRCVRFAMEELSEEQIKAQLKLRCPEKNDGEIGSAVLHSRGLLGRGLEWLSGEAPKAELLAEEWNAALGQSEWKTLEVCMKAAALSREEFGAFCESGCLELWQRARANPGESWPQELYETLYALARQAENNGSVSAMNGALAAKCGQLLFAANDR